MTSKRERILAAPDLEEEVVVVPQWEDEKVLIRGMDGATRAKFLKSVTRQVGGDRSEVDFTKFYPTLIINCAYDPEMPDELLFQLADRDALNTKSGAALDILAKVAMRLSGLGQDALEDAETDLKATPSDDST